MIRALKIFEINPTLNFIEDEGDMIRNTEPFVDIFFKNHIINSINNKYTKPCRFRDEESDVFGNCTACFTIENFEASSRLIAEELSRSIHYSVNDNFIFIVVWYSFEGENDYFNDDENILAILKMETSDGVQLLNNSHLDIKENMLPDLGNQLQKCAFVYESYVNSFDINNQGDRFHLKILYKQDKSIASYFINLMKSVVVADDFEMSKLAVSTIKSSVKNYVLEDDRSLVDNSLNVMMSRRENTSVTHMVNQLQDYIRMDMLNQSGIQTLDALADDIFEKILRRNPSATHDFRIEPVNPEKFFLRSIDRSVMISIEKGLIDDDTIETSEDDNNHYLTIPKEIVMANN